MQKTKQQEGRKELSLNTIYKEKYLFMYLEQLEEEAE